jgi:hypothetical protein
MRHRSSVVPAARRRLVAASSVLLMTASAMFLVSVLQPRPGEGRPAASPETPTVHEDPRSPPRMSPTQGAADVGRWREVLAVLDARRSRAYARGRPELLRGVYTRRSVVLRRDRALLRRYRDRGLRVVGLHLDVVDLAVQSQRRARTVLRVRDRVAAGAVVGTPARRTLPADPVDTRVVTLRRDPGGWRISGVAPSAPR